ncbi:MAG: hypothetical protein AAGD96_11305 [Chloroflexota bacterium]
MKQISLAGNINFLSADQIEQPFQNIQPLFDSVHYAFANLECCFFDTKHPETVEGREGFYLPIHLGTKLLDIGISAVGIANNGNAVQLNVVETTASNRPNQVAGERLIEKIAILKERSRRFNTQLSLAGDEIILNLNSSL